MLGTYTLAMPAAPRGTRPTHATYVRRRLLVLVLLATVLLGLGLAARTGLADEGSGPASASRVGRSDHVAGLVGDGTYIVQPGDSMWSIAARLHDGRALGAYVDQLVSMHGSTSIVAGERLRLP